MSERRFKVLFLPSWYPSRTSAVSGIFVEKQARAVSRFSDVGVLYVSFDKDLKDKAIDIVSSLEDGIRVVRAYFGPTSFRIPKISGLILRVRYLKAGYAGLKTLKAVFGRPDIAHVNVIYPAGFWAVILKKLKGLPFIVTEHSSSYMPADGSYKGTFVKFITRLTIKNASAVTTVSSFLRDAMLKHGLIAEYHVVPNVVENEPYEDISISSDNNVKNILHVSLLDDRSKNISGIIKALHSIKETRDDFQLNIVGDGADRNMLEGLARDLGLLGKHVIFHGMKPHAEVMDFMLRADFLVMNSNFETFSVVTAEAIASGTPVVVTRCGGPGDFVSDEVGILVEPRNQKELSDAISKMLDNCGKYDRSGLVEYARSRFAPEIIGKIFYGIYAKTLTKWSAGQCGETVHIEPEWSVLDIGSGHSPNPRADVCLERELEESMHRGGAKATIPEGKTLVVGDATAMPFKDKEFDFVIASHIAEHVEDIHALMSEIERVGKRGYIETPGPVSEACFSEPYHIWIISTEGDTIVFRRKKRSKPLSETLYGLFYLNEERMGHKTYSSKNFVLLSIRRLLNRMWKHLPFAYTKFHWDGKIKYKVFDE